MKPLPSLAAVLGATAFGATALGTTALGTTALAAATVAAAATTSPQTTVTASLLTRGAGTLAPGTKVRAASLGQRVFVNARHGFALASVGQAQYPAASSDGGRTWRTDGPALHVNAAQAPLVVTSIGAASAKTAYAFGGGQALDTTSDGGKKWYRALFNGLVMAVVPNSSGHLVAFVDGSAGSTGVTWQYVSKDGGRSWHLSTSVGGS
jgi:hypothetical protein